MQNWMDDYKREQRWENFTIFALPICAFLFLAGVVYYDAFHNTEEILMNATIIEHNVTSDRHGNATYNTLIEWDNGIIENIESKELYLVPNGSTIQKKRRVKMK